jgi:RNase P subunit RPR2
MIETSTDYESATREAHVVVTCNECSNVSRYLLRQLQSPQQQQQQKQIVSTEQQASEQTSKE